MSGSGPHHYPGGLVLAPLRLLRFLFVWPLIAAYERKAARSLRWRLAESHLLTVFVSVLAIAVIGGGVLVAYAFVENPVKQEPVNEAQIIAGMLQDMRLTSPEALSQPEVSSLLMYIATGEVGPNSFDKNVNLMADIGSRFDNIKSISIVGHDHVVLASSVPGFVNKDALLVGPTVLGPAESALNGRPGTSHESVLNRPNNKFITGSYPLYAVDENGEPIRDQVIAAVVVDKTDRTLPEGRELVWLAVNYVGQIGLTIAVLVGIPAIPVGLIIGLRRARGIAKPVSETAQAARSIAAGDLSVRVHVAGRDEIAELGHSFNKMADRLQDSLETEAEARTRAEQLLAANRDLVANVSHELRTPVALVRGHLEALETDPEHTEEYVRIALRETDRLERLVNDLFQLSRLENKIVKLERVPFDGGAAVREAQESLAEPARRTAGITMLAEVGEGDLRCLGDRARLIQVLQNLIRNAIRFTPEGGIILVGAHPEDEAVAFTVRDTGIGISEEDLPHVFERFYRSDSSRNRKSGGAGLGLAIAKELIEQMGGTIEVDSELEEGSVFTIRLPRAAAEPPVSSDGKAAKGTNGIGPLPPKEQEAVAVASAAAKAHPAVLPD
jgi:signal transduction histidine kinase